DYASITTEEQDEYDLDQLYNIIEKEILPLYYENYATWRTLMKNGMQDVRFQFESNRMAHEYYEKLYNAPYEGK
ncbi:MAG TPA: alpha-glucan family phosphorylase, partial [Niabella sp.]|nr:alpha-glucan family phosphorylase [Niabella sp.]